MQKNTLMINQLNTECVDTKAIDKFLNNLVFSETDSELLKNANLSVTGNLAYSSELKVGKKFMLIWNIDIEDCLINGQIGTVCHFMYNHQEVLRIYVKLDDLSAGIKTSCHSNIGRSSRWVLIEPNQVTFSLTEKSKNSVTITWTQFPLTLSYACVSVLPALGVLLIILALNLNDSLSFGSCLW